MNDFVSKTQVFKDLETTRVLKETEISFSKFNQGVITLTKSICRPDEYYVEGDEITFTIRLKNVGTKRIRKFVLKDELKDIIKPLVNDSYDVFTSCGIVESFKNPIVVSDITLEPLEEALVTITGIVLEEE